MPRKSAKKKAAEVVEVVDATVVEPVKKVTPVEEEDEVAWVRKQLSAAAKEEVKKEEKKEEKKERIEDNDIRDAINDPDSEFKFMPPDTNRSTASLAMVSAAAEEAAAPAKRGRKPKEVKPPVEAGAAKPVVDKPVAAAAPAKPTGKPAWLLAQEKAQAARTETVVAKPAVKAVELTDDSKAVKKTDAASSTLRIKSAPVVAPKPAPVKAVAVAEPATSLIEITPARVDMAVGKAHTSRMLPNQQVVTRIFSGIYNAEPCDSDVNGMF